MTEKLEIKAKTVKESKSGLDCWVRALNLGMEREL